MYFIIIFSFFFTGTSECVDVIYRQPFSFPSALSPLACLLHLLVHLSGDRKLGLIIVNIPLLFLELVMSVSVAPLFPCSFMKHLYILMYCIRTFEHAVLINTMCLQNSHIRFKIEHKKHRQPVILLDNQ